MIRPDSYPNSLGPDASHQFGSYKDETAVGANDGTGLFKDQMMDAIQWIFNLMSKFSDTPSGSKEDATTSEALEALEKDITLFAGNVDTINVSGNYTVLADNKNGILLCDTGISGGTVTLLVGSGLDDGSRLTIQNNSGGTVTVNPGGITLLDEERIILFYNTHISAFDSLLGDNVILGTWHNTLGTQSTSSTTGANKFDGGMGIVKNLYVGQLIRCEDVTDSTNKDSGSIVTEGGLGVEKNINAGGDITGLGIKLTDLFPAIIGLNGAELNIAGVGIPALAAMSSSRVAFIDSVNDNLRAYDFDGSNWTLTGVGLPITTVGTPALTALLATRIAFIDNTNDNLRAYDFDGSNWTLTGVGLPITTVGTPAIAAMSSSRIAFIDSTNQQIRAYDFDGSNWTLTGSGLNIGGTTSPSLAALSSTRVAFIDSGNKDLRVYEFNGSTWSQVGNDLNIASLSISSLAAFSSNKIALIDSVNDDLRIYEFDGSDWEQVGNELNIAGAGQPALTSMSGVRLAFIDDSNADLRAYSVAWGPKPPTPFEGF